MVARKRALNVTCSHAGSQCRHKPRTYILPCQGCSFLLTCQQHGRRRNELKASLVLLKLCLSLAAHKGIQGVMLVSPFQQCGSLVTVSAVGDGCNDINWYAWGGGWRGVTLWQLRQVAFAPLTSRWWQKHHYVSWCIRFLTSWKQERIHICGRLESWLDKIASCCVFLPCPCHPLFVTA